MGMKGIPIRIGELFSRVTGPAIGAEIGIFRGNMSQAMLENKADLFLYMVDSWVDTSEQPEPYRQIGDYHAKLKLAAQMEHKQAAIDSTEMWANRRRIMHMKSVEAAKLTPDGSLDFVFIDSDHSYEGCKSDIEAWTPKVRPGGWLSGHDYDLPNFPLFGVKRAVDEATEKNGWALELGQNYTWFVRL